MKHLLPLTLLPALLAGCGRPAAEAPLPGYAEAELVYIAPAAAGRLQTLAVRRGDSVQAGQPLFALAPDAEQHGREAASARRERAQAQTDNLLKGRRPSEIAAIDQQLVQARAALEVSTATLQRNRQLVDTGFQAPLRLDELLAARERDAARVQELQAQRATAVAAARADEIAAARAELRAADADLALARWREAETQRVAPQAGLVFDTLYRPGEWVPAGAPVLALLPPGALKLRFFVPETALPRVAPGREVQLSCDGCPAGLTARVRYVSPQAEYTPPVIYSNEARAKLVFLVEAEPAAGAPLKPGQPVDVRLPS